MDIKQAQISLAQYGLRLAKDGREANCFLGVLQRMEASPKAEVIKVIGQAKRQLGINMDVVPIDFKVDEFSG